MTIEEDRERESALTRFSLLCGNLVWIIPGSTLAALALAICASDQLSPSFRLGWFSFVCIIQAIRLGFLRHWMRVPMQAATVQNRLYIATGLSFVTACCIGLFGYFAISPNEPIVSLLVVMVLVGMVAISSAAVSYILPLYLSFVLPVMVPAIVRAFSFGESTYVWIGTLLIMYLAASIVSTRYIRASISRSIELRFENTELVEDLKHQHQRAEASLAREEKANLAKSRFLAAASHDLRQPLHSLRLFTATLEMQTRNSEHKALVTQIDSSVKSLEELFNALLDISKLDAGTIDVDRNHVYLDLLLKQIESEFRLLAEDKQLSFVVQQNGEVVETDMLLLERLIRNVISNAFRYTSSGEVRIVSATGDDERVWISISDTGIGIPVTDQCRVYEEFVQLGNVERDRNQGIGLGLSIVKRLADLLNVELQLESTEGVGSTFRIGVPQGDAALCRKVNESPQPSSAHIGSLFVLVIDDEEEVCLAVEGLLESWGCVVMCANSGDAASQQLQEIGNVPDLVISDYRLRYGETGGDVIKRLRKELAIDVPAIILSGDIAPERLIDIQALGFPLLHKPCEPEALRQLIARETASPLTRCQPGSVSSLRAPIDERELYGV